MAMGKKTESALPPNALLFELRGLIESARQHVAQTANATLTQCATSPALQSGKG